MNMRHLTMINTPATSYFVAGTTAGVGAVRSAQEQMLIVDPHIYLGFSLSEIALCMGILGTVVTMTFQYLNYLNNKKKNSESR